MYEKDICLEHKYKIIKNTGTDSKLRDWVATKSIYIKYWYAINQKFLLF